MRQRELAAADHHDDASTNDELHHSFAGDGMDLRQWQLDSADHDHQQLHHCQAGSQLDMRQRELAAAEHGGTTTTTSCTTASPGTGWTCVNGNWLPPSTSDSTCTTVKPGTNWTCVNGNWLPPS